MSRAAYRKVLIQYRRKVFAESLVCHKCGNKVGDLPKVAEDDMFYLSNKDFWIDFASNKGRRSMCRRCQIIMARVRSNKRRAAISASVDHFSDDDVVRLFESQDGRCVYCATDLMMEKYHVDHINPLSKGGSNGPGNIQLTCPTCNLSKGVKTHDEFMVYRLHKLKR